MPTTPQKAAGWRMEPPVSEPRAKAASWAATAAADPPELPPGTRSSARGLCVTLKKLFSVLEPMANSSIFSLPNRTNRWPFSFSMTVAS